MNIDLSLLHSNTVFEVDITGTYNISSDYYSSSDIVDLLPVGVVGKIIQRRDENNNIDDYVDCQISGEMVLLDSITLERVIYPFKIKYDDFLSKKCLKSENILDIFEFIWENIVLEVPLQFTKVKDLSEFHGDGWRLISEDTLKNDVYNPFSDLLNSKEEE